MTYWSEEAVRLTPNTVEIKSALHLKEVDVVSPGVYLFRFPTNRTETETRVSDLAFAEISSFCETLNEESTVCVLASPTDAARLLPVLEPHLKFQLWVAVKAKPIDSDRTETALSNRHVALLVLTRYRGSLRHTKTRIGYTYCPACGKTTKDYGGKKHTYHEYGTLMSDVWRDIEINPEHDIEELTTRLCDLFGLSPNRSLHSLDLRTYPGLKRDTASPKVRELGLPLQWEAHEIPCNSNLIHADCMEGLRTIADNSVDFCFTDPPYNIQKKYDSWHDALESVEYFKWCDHWLSELYRVLKPGRTLAILNIPQWAVRHYQHLASFMDYQNWIVWEGLSLPVRMIMPSHYTILCFSKGKPRRLPSYELAAQNEQEYVSTQKENYCLRASCLSQRTKMSTLDQEPISDLWWDVHRLKHNSRRVDHPCQLPPFLMRRLYALFTHPGETILDCFDGAGTSTLIAHQMERRFIGIELSEQYHLLAKERHAQLLRGEDPFGRVEAIPKTKNSRVKRVTHQNYAVSKKALQLDVKRIAQELGRMPTREDIQQCSPYPIEYFDSYFVSWGEVRAAARTTGMSELPLDQVSNRVPQSQLVMPLD